MYQLYTWNISYTFMQSRTLTFLLYKSTVTRSLIVKPISEKVLLRVEYHRKRCTLNTSHVLSQRTRVACNFALKKSASPVTTLIDGNITFICYLNKTKFSNSTSTHGVLHEDPSNSNSTPQWSYLSRGSRSRSLPVD